ncbi:FAD dependent oxidoreductase [sediment metagenome]|uniref:FAD dependent oxidoreductase n=2 Tax=unclassified sequences TaxID=12908 RepID=D9PIU3_9ZZZZ
MTKVITEPAREVPVRDEVDVLVCGGGCAGVAAALAAARNGARTCLVEHYGFAGGTLTAAGVNGIGGYQHDLDGRPLVSGIPIEIVQRLAEADGASPESVARLTRPVDSGPVAGLGLNVYWVQAHPEKAKGVFDDMLGEAGVRILYHADAVMPVMEGSRVRGAFVESKSGREAILARVLVDCTGDGDIAARAGAPFDLGRPGDGACQPMTAIFTVADWSARAHNDAMKSEPLAAGRYQGYVARSRADGEIALNPNDIFCAATYLDDRESRAASVNFTRVQGLSALDAGELSRAEVLGRRQVAEAVRFMRKHMAGGANCALISVAAQIGIRESRRILGDYVLTGQDVQGAARFPDAVARGIYTLDIHNPTEVGKPSALIELEKPYDIPYRCLVPRGVEGLLVAGRCISGDHIALSSYRIQSHCMAMGQAAGTAAALAAAAGKRPRELDVGLLRRRLGEDGANTGEKL